MGDEIDPKTRAIIDALASELRSTAGTVDGRASAADAALRARISECETVLGDLDARLVDIEQERSLATIRDEVRQELAGGSLWPEARSSIIRWGIPAILAAAVWAFTTWVRSL